VLVAIFVATTLSSNAQLPGGSFGVGAQFGGSNSMAVGHYALTDNMDIGVGLGYVSTSYDYDEPGVTEQDPESHFGFQGMFRYFLAKGKDVSPYVGGFISYSSHPGHKSSYGEETKSDLGLGAIFGGQVFLAKNFAVYGHVALGWNQYTDDFSGKEGVQDYTNTETTISLSGSGVGAVFYF
jgi:hypothetical protein